MNRAFALELADALDSIAGARSDGEAKVLIDAADAIRELNSRLDYLKTQISNWRDVALYGWDD